MRPSIKALNIAIFASQFYPHIGGVEELVRQLAHEEAREGHRPLVVTNRWPRNLPAHENFEGLNVRRYEFRVPTGKWKWRAAAIALGPFTLRKICADMKEWGAQLIHVQCASSNAYYAIRVKRRLNIPMVVTLQGELTMDPGGIFKGRDPFFRNLYLDTLKSADAVTACSRYTLDEAQKFFNLSFGGKGAVIYNGIDPAEYVNAAPYMHERPYILAAGRLAPQKGFDVLLRAFAALIRDGGRTHDLLLAGDGFESGNLERLTAELGVQDRVHFLGPIPHNEMIGLFAGCSFFVLPSRLEPFGIVNLEAMASGKAVIASGVGGVPEVVLDGETGLLVPPENVGALSAAMSRLIADAGLRDSLGTAGRLRAQNFSWQTITEQYLSVYKKVGMH